MIRFASCFTLGKAHVCEIFQKSRFELIGSSEVLFYMGNGPMLGLYITCWDATKGTSWGSCSFTGPLNEEWWTTPTFCSSGNWLVNYTNIGVGVGVENSLGFQCHHIGSRANYAKFMVTIFLLWGSTKLAPGTNSIAHKFAEISSPLGPPIFPQKCEDPKVKHIFGP
jgi:hypothetical protein